jgi:hypothetical protein
MSALAPVQAPPVLPVPWRALAWVTWRRYRTTLAATTGVLAVIGVYLLVDGARMRSVYATYLACTPNHSAKCQFAWQNFHEAYGAPGLLGTILLLFLPGIIGAFAGAPALAREFETGTFRFAWTQGVGRIRWAMTAIVPGAVGVAVIIGGFGALISWHNQPLIDGGITPRLHPTVFPVTGLAAPGGRWPGSPSACSPDCCGAVSCPGWRPRSPPGSDWRSWPPRYASTT